MSYKDKAYLVGRVVWIWGAPVKDRDPVRNGRHVAEVLCVGYKWVRLKYRDEADGFKISRRLFDEIHEEVAEREIHEEVAEVEVVVDLRQAAEEALHVLDHIDEQTEEFPGSVRRARQMLRRALEGAGP